MAIVARLLEKSGRVVLVREVPCRDAQLAPDAVTYRGGTYVRAAAQRGGWVVDYRLADVIRLEEH